MALAAAAGTQVAGWAAHQASILWQHCWYVSIILAPFIVLGSDEERTRSQ